MALPSLATADEVPARPASWAGRGAEVIATYGPAAVILTLPLEFTALYLRQPLARWILLVLAVAFVYLLVTGRRTLELPRFPSAAVLLAFVGFALASWVVTRPPGSLRLVGDVAVYPIVGVLLMNVIRERKEHRRAWSALLLSGLIVGAAGVGLGLSHHAIWSPNPVVANRDNITFADPNITARFLTVCAAAAVMLFSARRVPNWLAAGCAAACAIATPMTFSRSGLVLFVFSVALAIALALDRRRALAFGMGAIVVFALSTAINPDTRQRAMDAATTVVTAVTGTAHNMSSRPSTGSSGDTFALEDDRRYLIAAGVTMFADHPVTGVGFGAYQNEIKTAYRRFIPPDIPNPDTVSHTVFVTVAAELGVAGIALLLAFLVLVAREAWHVRHHVWAATPAAMVVPIVLYSQFEGRLLEEPYLWLMLALFYSAVLRRKSRTAHSPTM